MMLKKWIKKGLGITALEDENKKLVAELQGHRQFVYDKVAELRDYTRVDADIGIRGNNTIILSGVYRKQGYVRFWDVGDGEFQQLVRQMKDMKDHCLVRNIDKPPSIQGMFEI